MNVYMFLQDPAYSTGKFGEVRELILGMLETYNYEQVNMNPGFIPFRLFNVVDCHLYLSKRFQR